MSFLMLSRAYLTAVLLGLAALFAGLAIWLPPIDKESEVMDVMFVIDITQSMNVEDVVYQAQKVNRIDWSTSMVHEALQEMDCGSRAGLGIFSEYRSLILINPVEVCENYDVLVQALTRIDGPMAWAQASEVSKALFSLIKNVRKIKPSPAIVFLTDGHESPPLHETIRPRFVGTPGAVPGVLVGVGGDELLPIPRRDKHGDVIGVWEVKDVLHHDVYVSSRFNMPGAEKQVAKTEHLSSQKRAHLQGLAGIAGMDYISDVLQAKAIISAVKKVANTRPQIVKYSLAPWFSLAALCLLVWVYYPKRNKSIR